MRKRKGEPCHLNQHRASHKSCKHVRSKQIGSGKQSQDSPVQILFEYQRADFYHVFEIEYFLSGKNL